MTDIFVERITRTRTDKGETVSGRMVETRSQKSSDVRKTMLEVEVHPAQAMNDSRQKHGSEGRGNRRLASESTPVEQGQDFASFTGTLDLEEMSELSDISTEIVATRRQHYHGRRGGETGDVLIVFRKSEEHFRKHLCIHHGSGYRR